MRISARRRPFPLFRWLYSAQGRDPAEIDEKPHQAAYHFHGTLGVVGQIIPGNFPAADGGLEARAGAWRRGNCRRSQNRQSKG